MNAARSEAAIQARAPALHEGLRANDLAFFLDVDGTLLDIAPTPGEVFVDRELIAHLGSVSAARMWLRRLAESGG